MLKINHVKCELLKVIHKQNGNCFHWKRCFSQESESLSRKRHEILNRSYDVDEMTNVTPSIVAKLGKSLHNKKNHPIYLIRQRIQDFFYRNYLGRTGNPLFAVFDNLSPVVPLTKNFDSLLVPANHPSRHPKDSYYLNEKYMLRAHTTCHSCDIIRSGLDRFLTVGDVYRRDTIDRTHYPVFHQMDAVRLYNSEERGDNELILFDDVAERTPCKQGSHTEDTLQLLTISLQKTLVDMAHFLFGKDIEYRWVNAYFPFTHPSWELEIKYQGEWLEVLGCGILEQTILANSGVTSKVGWAFGLGLERLAMKLYSIPDVRLFWSEDPGFLLQFDVTDCHTPITYKEVSKFPSLAQDISFWLADSSTYSSNDFYDLARTVGGDLVEQVDIIDEYTDTKTGKTSHTYRVTYRHMLRNLTTKEINCVQEELRKKVEQDLRCNVRQ